MAAKNGTKKKASARKSSAGIASPMDAESVELIPRRWWWVLLCVGVLSIALGLVMAAVYSIPYAIDEPGRMNLPFVDEYPTVVEILLRRSSHSSSEESSRSWASSFVAGR